MTEPVDLILPLIREMRVAIATFGSEAERWHRDVLDRLDRIEQTRVSFRHVVRNKVRRTSTIER